MASSVNASNTGFGGILMTGDSSGQLQLQTAATTALTIDTSQNTTLAGKLTTASTGIQFSDASIQTAAASPYVLKNRIINGAMAISQRGTTINSINSDYTYTADRWSIQRGGSINYSQGTSNPPTGFQYYASYINQTASNPFLTINQIIETANCYDLAGQTVTLSAYIKAAANTAASTSISLNYGYSTSADTRYTIVGTATNFTLSSSSWTRCSITFTVPSTALTLSPVFNSTSSLAVGDGYLITGVQLEQNTSATPFERRLYGQELINCQRYYYQITGGGTNSFAAVGSVGAATATVAVVVTPLPVSMRTTPTVNYSGTINIDCGAGSTGTISSMGSTYGSTGTVWYSVNTSGMTAGKGGVAYTSNASTNYMTYSAEL
jgi:hypothetical protein